MLLRLLNIVYSMLLSYYTRLLYRVACGSTSLLPIEQREATNSLCLSEAGSTSSSKEAPSKSSTRLLRVDGPPPLSLLLVDPGLQQHRVFQNMVFSTVSPGTVEYLEAVTGTHITSDPPQPRSNGNSGFAALPAVQRRVMFEVLDQVLVQERMAGVLRK